MQAINPTITWNTEPVLGNLLSWIAGTYGTAENETEVQRGRGLHELLKPAEEHILLFSQHRSIFSKPVAPQRKLRSGFIQFLILGKCVLSVTMKTSNAHSFQCLTLHSMPKWNTITNNPAWALTSAGLQMEAQTCLNQSITNLKTGKAKAPHTLISV